MNYLSEMLKLPVVDAAGEKIGIVNDLGIATGEVFPRVTALAFQGPGKTLPPTFASPTYSPMRCCWRATS